MFSLSYIRVAVALAALVSVTSIKAFTCTSPLPPVPECCLSYVHNPLPPPNGTLQGLVCVPPRSNGTCLPTLEPGCCNPPGGVAPTGCVRV